MSTNKPEKLQPPYPGGDPVVGKALRAFFLSLLDDKNLYAYHQNRVAYINANVTNGKAKALLNVAGVRQHRAAHPGDHGLVTGEAALRRLPAVLGRRLTRPRRSHGCPSSIPPP